MNIGHVCGGQQRGFFSGEPQGRRLGIGLILSVDSYCADWSDIWSNGERAFI